MSCLSEEEVLSLVDGDVPPIERSRLLHHVERCCDCRELVAEVLRDDVPRGEPSSEERDLTVLPRPGDRIGRYVLRERLGSGGMGIVFAAYDTEVDRCVALKIMAPRLHRGAMDELRRRLGQEAVAMARVAHRNVVSVYDVGSVGGSVYLVMERIEGQTLAVEETRTSSWQETLNLYLQAGDGLCAAHRVGVIHRDVKPENILVDARRNARVTDFGLAAIACSSDVEGGASASSPPRSMYAVGTRRFMAPEALRGRPTEHSDQYSFAFALEEALGRHRDSLPGEISAALRRATASREADRFPSMEALLTDLRAALARDEQSRETRELSWLVLALASLVLALPLLFRCFHPGDAGLSPDRLIWALAVQSAAFLAIRRFRPGLWNGRQAGPVLRAAAAVGSVGLCIALGLSPSPQLRPLIPPLWLLLDALAVAYLAALDETAGALVAIGVLGLYVLACYAPSAQLALLTCAGVLSAALVLVRSRRRWGEPATADGGADTTSAQDKHP